MSRPRREVIDTAAKWMGATVSLAGLLWGIATALQTQGLAARRPYLEQQLKLYNEATETAAILATAADGPEREKAETRFRQLYWGVLAMVENGGTNAKSGGVEGAMVRFNDLLRKKSTREDLQQGSLSLAHTCRDSLAASWGVKDWASPSYGLPEPH